MAKLVIATITYRAYLRVEDENASKEDMKELVAIEEKDISAWQEPINVSVWEWMGDKLDPSFLESIAFGDNPDDKLTVQEVAKQHRGYNWQVDVDNPGPVKPLKSNEKSEK